MCESGVAHRRNGRSGKLDEVRWWIALLVGCGYHPQVALDVDAPSSDSAVADSPPTFSACTLASSAEPVAATPAFIGGSGGQPRADATCAAGELPIGLWFHVSEDGIPDHADQVAMVDLHMRCGRLTRGSDGVFTTTPQERFDSTGGNGGNCSAYFPNAEVAEVTCPSGRVLVGIDGNRLDDTLYNSVVLRCAAVAASGAITGDVVALPVAGTGASSNQPMSASCAAGAAVASFQIKSGCGHDHLAPRCAPVACN